MTTYETLARHEKVLARMKAERKAHAAKSKALNAKHRAAIQAARKDGMSITAIAAVYDVSRPMIYHHLGEA